CWWFSPIFQSLFDHHWDHCYRPFCDAWDDLSRDEDGRKGPSSSPPMDQWIDRLICFLVFRHFPCDDHLHAPHDGSFPRQSLSLLFPHRSPLCHHQHSVSSAERKFRMGVYFFFPKHCVSSHSLFLWHLSDHCPFHQQS